MNPSAYIKAIVACIVAALGAAAAALADDQAINASEWVAIAAAFFVTFGAVWVAPKNAPAQQ